MREQQQTVNESKKELGDEVRRLHKRHIRQIERGERRDLKLRTKWHDWVVGTRMYSQQRVKEHTESRLQQVAEDKQMQLEALKLMLKRKQAHLSELKQ